MRHSLIRERRQILGVTIGELAAVLGVSVGAVSMWERGEVMPTESNIAKLAATLGVNADELRKDVHAARMTFVQQAKAKVRASKCTVE